LTAPRTDKWVEHKQP